jgi:hypothetical protein
VHGDRLRGQLGDRVDVVHRDGQEDVVADDLDEPWKEK